MTLTAGQSGTATVTVTPSQVFVASLNDTGAPSFVTVSCSGLPHPFLLHVYAGEPGDSAGPGCGRHQFHADSDASPDRRRRAARKARTQDNPVAWAILLPGMLGLGGLAWGARRRRWLQRLTLVALVGLVTTLGTTGCNPRYYYYNHGPGNPPATPSGTFTVTVAGQSSNGVTAITNTTTFQLTVQ